MLKGFFSGSMQRMFSCIVLICVLAIVVIGAYSWNVVSTSLFQQVEKTSLLQMRRADEEMTNLVEKVEASVLGVSEGQSIYQDAACLEADVIAHLTNSIDTEIIGACFLKTSDNRIYSHNPDSIYVDMVQLQLFCNKNITGDRSLKWYNGNNENYARNYDNYYIVCTSVPEGEMKWSMLYLFIRKEKIDVVLTCMQDKNNTVLILENGNLLSVNDKERLDEITKSTLDIMFRLYETEEGFFEFEKYSERYITSHFQQPDSEFKFLAIYETKEFYRDGYKILKVMLLLMAFFALLIVALYHLIKKQYLKPLEELVSKMRNTDKNLDEDYIAIRGNKEINVLVDQYNRMRGKIREMLLDVRKQEELKRQAEVEMLRYQINPHFFYNTLSNIKMLALSKGQTEISSTISKFANMYRYLFSNKSNFVNVGDEIEFIRNYISLMNTRYDNRLNTFFFIEESVNERKIPVFILQPIVENAITHGLYKMLNEKKECFLRISIKETKNMLKITVHDNGCGISDEKLKKLNSMKDTDRCEFGLGLYNTIKRLKYQYGDKFELIINSVENEYTEIMVEIPIEI